MEDSVAKRRGDNTVAGPWLPWVTTMMYWALRTNKMGVLLLDSLNLKYLHGQTIMFAEELTEP